MGVERSNSDGMAMRCLIPEVSYEKKMKSIERNYNNVRRHNPYWSTHTCFAVAVRGGKFSRGTISRWFNKLVDKDDYAPKEKKLV